MNVRVKLFAVARERVGQSEVNVDVPDQATVRHLRSALVERFPQLADVIPHVRFAANNEYASESRPLEPLTEIAVIPPVSGG